MWSETSLIFAESVESSSGLTNGTSIFLYLEHISIIFFESEESANLWIALRLDTNLKVCSTRGIPPKSIIFLFFMPLDPALAGIKPKIFNL